MDYINFDHGYFAFGNSVFNKNAVKFAVNYLNNSYLLLKGKEALEFDGWNSTGLFDIITDPALKHNIIFRKDVKYIGKEKLLKALIQVYNQRMIDNRLTIE